MQFKDIIDDERILKTLESLGYTEPTAIQAEAIPQILKGGDLRASSQTGSGKSAAFLLPALMRISKAQERRHPKVLILAPTRELAIQLAAEAQKLGRSLNVVTVLLYGGVPYSKQYRDLSRPHDILIATPGRLMDHIEQKRVQLNQIDTFILDEADRMLDMGFIGPVETIAARMPSAKQTLMFTATFGKGVRKLSASLLKDPFEIATHATEESHANIEQKFVQTDSLGDKQRHLEKVLSEEKIDQAIIFSSTKMQTRRIADDLRDQGLLVGALHGDLNQRQRTNTLRQFREGRIKFLVATDVAGRGIDVLTISHVINFDVPKNLDDYIHRIGRTGRAGNKGVALSFFSSKDWEIRREIEKFSGVTIPGGSGGSRAGGEPRSNQRSRSPQRKAPWQTEKRRFGRGGNTRSSGDGARGGYSGGGNSRARSDGDRGGYGGGGGRKPSFFSKGPSQKSKRP